MLRKRILTGAVALAIVAGAAAVASAPANAVTGSNVAIFVQSGGVLRVVDLAPQNGPTITTSTETATTAFIDSTAPIQAGAGCTRISPRWNGVQSVRCVGLTARAQFDLGGSRDILRMASFPVPVLVNAGEGNDDLDIQLVSGTGTELNGEGGIDHIKTYVASKIDGGRDGDTLIGSNQRDEIIGGSGNDIIKGFKGNDIVRVRDGERDTDVTCNDGPHDQIQMDANDAHAKCEDILP